MGFMKFLNVSFEKSRLSWKDYLSPHRNFWHKRCKFQSDGISQKPNQLITAKTLNTYNCHLIKTPLKSYANFVLIYSQYQPWIKKYMLQIMDAGLSKQWNELGLYYYILKARRSVYPSYAPFLTHDHISQENFTPVIVFLFVGLFVSIICFAFGEIRVVLRILKFLTAVVGFLKCQCSLTVILLSRKFKCCAMRRTGNASSAKVIKVAVGKNIIVE